MTVEEFKKKVEEVTKVSPNAQRLIYGGKQLEDKKCLGDYPTMGDGSTVFLVLRLLGGVTRRRIDHSLPRSREPCMITYMANEPDFPVLKMPCGHSISPDGLMDYCWSQIDLGKYEIKCCLYAQQNGQWKFTHSEMNVTMYMYVSSTLLKSCSDLCTRDFF